jgi:hypothetical protein
MTGGSALSTILASQTPSGAFPSVAHLPTGPVHDENAFVTALVLCLLLSDVNPEPWVAGACGRGVDFLLQCQRPSPPGSFAFYPAHAQPAWIGEFLPPDADDTALCSLALFRAGVWPRSQLRSQVLDVLDRYRLQRRPPGADWFRAGTYPTWLETKRLHNPIDVCVNVNVLVLIEVSGAGTRHGHGIVEMVDAALDWVGDSPERARAIMPYYPHPAELIYALERAAAAGVCGAGGLLERVRTQPWSLCEDPVNAPVCSSLGAGIVWTSPVLHAVRSWMRKRNNQL